MVKKCTDFIPRNRPLGSGISDAKISNIKILIAGCSSIGGSVVEPLAKLGIGKFILAEFDSSTLYATKQKNLIAEDTSFNEAQELVKRVNLINPESQCLVFSEKVTSDNIDVIVSEADYIIDGIDITTLMGLQDKYLLHETASFYGIPVVVGYDLAGLQYIKTYRYTGSTFAFDGEIKKQDLYQNSALPVLKKLMRCRGIPLKMLRKIQWHNQITSFPQQGHTSLAFAALVAHVILQLNAREAVCKEVILDADKMCVVRSKNFFHTGRIIYKKYFTLLKIYKNSFGFTLPD